MKSKILRLSLVILVLLAVSYVAIESQKFLWQESTEWMHNYINMDIGRASDVNHVPLEALSVEGKIRRIFKEKAELATAVFKAESGLRCEAESSTGDYGPAQINYAAHGHRWPLEQIKNCTENIKIAYQLYKEWGGFTPWVAYNRNLHLKYLNQ